MKKVVKFGGSSLANAKQFKKVADIIKADKSRRYVVPSAPGKRNDKDEKVTDMLYACYDAVAEGRSYKKILDKIKERYNEIIDGLDLNLNLDHEFDKIEENFLAKAGRDYAASRGEYLNGIVMANYLGYEFIDAADGNFNEVEKYINMSTSLVGKDLKSFHVKMWLFTHGIATLIASGAVNLTDEEISNLLSSEFKALMLLGAE